MQGLTPQAIAMLHAVLGMGVLTLAMTGWMVATRIPAMSRLGLPAQAGAHTTDLQARLPSGVRRVSDNYNHLFEAPTLFYAVTLAIVALGLADAAHAACAWAYLGLRAAHSVVQATVNVVPLRFALFGLSTAALATMILRAIVASF